MLARFWLRPARLRSACHPCTRADTSCPSGQEGFKQAVVPCRSNTKLSAVVSAPALWAIPACSQLESTKEGPGTESSICAVLIVSGFFGVEGDEMAVSLWAETQNACEGGELGSGGSPPQYGLVLAFLSDRRRLFRLATFLCSEKYKHKRRDRNPCPAVFECSAPEAVGIISRSSHSMNVTRTNTQHSKPQLGKLVLRTPAYG